MLLLTVRHLLRLVHRHRRRFDLHVNYIGKRCEALKTLLRRGIQLINNLDIEFVNVITGKPTLCDFLFANKRKHEILSGLRLIVGEKLFESSSATKKNFLTIWVFENDTVIKWGET